jgi:hypothetical protein
MHLADVLDEDLGAVGITARPDVVDEDVGAFGEIARPPAQDRAAVPRRPGAFGDLVPEAAQGIGLLTRQLEIVVDD